MENYSLIPNDNIDNNDQIAKPKFSKTASTNAFHSKNNISNNTLKRIQSKRASFNDSSYKELKHEKSICDIKLQQKLRSVKLQIKVEKIDKQ